MALKGKREESLLGPIPVKISGIADIQICAFKVFVLSPHHISGNKHPKMIVLDH